MVRKTQDNNHQINAKVFVGDKMPRKMNTSIDGDRGKTAAISIFAIMVLSALPCFLLHEEVSHREEYRTELSEQDSVNNENSLFQRQEFISLQYFIQR